MKRFSERLIAATMFVTALGGTLVLLPLALDNPAFALDAQGQAADGRPEHRFPKPSERVEARIAYVKTALKITDAQSKPWNALADVMRRQAKEHDAEFAAMRDHKSGDATIIDRMEFRQKMMTQRASELGELLAVARPLYASFSPEQKEAADSLVRMHMEHGPWGHHGFGHDGHGPDGHAPDGHGPGGAGPQQSQ
jgi:hypothetical protein